ncbi:MAG: low specificity L-threonine aldolase, partial [Hyphomonadaceae bacterium]
WPHAKVTPDGLEEALTRNQRGVHSVLPTALSISQATEKGAVYSASEVAALADIAHRAGLALHMDGARLANAAVHLGASLRELTRDACVDVLSFGATKNGALAAEAIVVFDPKRAQGIARIRKRSGHLFSKHRYLAAQWLAYLEEDVWRANAARANGLAAKIGAVAGDWLSAPVETNQIFIKPGVEKLAALRRAGADFYDWGAPGSGEARLVVSWDHEEVQVDALCAAIAQLK